MTRTQTAGSRCSSTNVPASTNAAAGAGSDLELEVLWRNRHEPAARAALVERFMPLARSLARRYERSTEPLDDLVQVASLGLVKAIDRFDDSMGNAFVSFAVPTILGELRRYFRDCCWDVHVPRGAQERALKLEEAQYRLSVDLGRSPTAIELAQYLELDVEQVMDAMQAAQAYGAVSLDSPLTGASGDEGVTLGDSFGEIDERFAQVEDGATVAGALKHLPPRERKVLELRFGADMTQSEIAACIGVSQMHVSRLLRHALDRLQILVRAVPVDSDAGLPG
jgi:RNA polymerase sigma-B factor